MSLSEYKKLSDIAYIKTGYPFDGHKYSKKGYRVIRGENIGAGFLHWEERIDKRWDLGVDGLKGYWVNYGDIVLQMDGNIGKNIARIQTKEPMLLAQRVGRIVAKEGYSQDYIYGILRSKTFYTYIRQCTTGTSIQHVSLKQIGDFIFPFHEKEKQEGIGKMISCYDQKIALNRQINDNLEAMARQLYDYWFVQFDFPDENGNPYKSNGGKLSYSEKLKREVPKKWKVGAIAEVSEVYNGATPSTSDPHNYGGDIVWITPKDLSDQQQKFVYHGERNITQKGYDSCSTHLLPCNTILMSSRAPIGLLAISKTELCTNQGFKSFVPKNEIFSTYLYYYLQVHIQQIEQMGTGTTFKEVSRDDVLRFPILLPDDRLISKWENIVAPINERQLKIQKENEELTKQRDELLPLLMNGQVSVNYHLSDD